MILPDFKPKMVEVWFHLLEAQFLEHGITSETSKFNLAVTKLDERTLPVVEHIILSNTKKNKYTEMKNDLLKKYVEAPEEKFTRLVQGMNIGDKQPSELLREMAELGQSLVDPTVIRSFWVNRLPNQTRIAVSTMLDTADTDKLTTLADRIYKIEIGSSPNPQVFAVQKSE